MILCVLHISVEVCVCMYMAAVGLVCGSHTDPSVTSSFVPTFSTDPEL